MFRLNFQLILGQRLLHEMMDSSKTSGVALTQISAYSTHKNLAVRKIMEVMRTAHAKSGIQSRHVSNYTNDHGRHTSIVKGKRASFANNISVFR